MSWEKRRGSGRYYTRSRRVRGHIVREYFGTGPVAELAAQEDAERRAQREACAAAIRAVEEHYAAADAAVTNLTEVCELAEAVALMLAGYKKHHREWRRTRS